MAIPLDPSILSALSFNKITDFEEQVKEIDPDHLLQIGRIFVQNNVHDRLAAEILHRHIELEEGTLLFHERNGDGLEVCRVAALNELHESNLQGCSFYLNEANQFQAYEFEQGTTTDTIAAQFATDMRDYLLKHGLHNQISIVQRCLIDTCEFMLASDEGDGTIRVPIDQVTEDAVDGCRLITTEFHFDEMDGVVQCKGQTVHAQQVNGNHRIFIDTKLRKRD